MKESKLINKLRIGDVIGTAPWWHNRFYNFFKLWFLRDADYAKKHWKEIVPTKYYIVCRRESDLMYAATAYKEFITAHMEYTSLKKLGSIVFIGRQRCFDSLQSQKDLNSELAGIHYFMVAEYRRKGVKNVFCSNRKIRVNVRFIMYAVSAGGYDWHETDKLKHFRPKPLDIIELGDFTRV
jgi:hypothetical protein